MREDRPAIQLKSVTFRQEREADWRTFDDLLKRTEKRGLRRLSAAELLQLPSLYFSVLSSLSVARAISLDRNVVDYLEGLAARGFFIVYGARGSMMQRIFWFLRAGFPRAVRRHFLAIAVAVLSMAAGVLTAYWLVAENADWYYAFVSSEMAGGRTPSASTEDLRGALYQEMDGEEMLSEFATYLFSHNSRVGIFSFALGFAFAVPSILLLFYNGLVLGAFLALFTGRGLGADLGAWLSVHGTTELTAIFLCGGAGIVVGRTLAFPGELSRLDALARYGREAAAIVVGAILMLFLAGLLEGYARQLITDMTMRYTIGGGMAAFWLAYFTLAGRSGRDP